MLNKRRKKKEANTGPLYQKLGDAAITEFFAQEFYVVWKICQNLRAVTAIMIHKVWPLVTRNNIVEKGSPVSAHIAPEHVWGMTLDKSLSPSTNTCFPYLYTRDDNSAPSGRTRQGNPHGELA